MKNKFLRSTIPALVHPKWPPRIDGVAIFRAGFAAFGEIEEDLECNASEKDD